MGDTSTDMGYRLQGQRYVTDQINATCREENIVLTKPPFWDSTGWIRHDVDFHTVKLCTQKASESLSIDDAAVVDCGKRKPFGEELIAKIRKTCRVLKGDTRPNRDGTSIRSKAR